MRRHGGTVLAIAILVLGACKARAEEVVANSGPLPAAAITQAPADVPAGDCHGAPSLCQRLGQWLTYRPVPHSCACGGCCKPCEPCGMPPLYLFFLCDRYGHGGCGCPANEMVPEGQVLQKSTKQQ
jgi:hypothetical protein